MDYNRASVALLMERAACARDGYAPRYGVGCAERKAHDGERRHVDFHGQAHKAGRPRQHRGDNALGSRGLIHGARIIGPVRRLRPVSNEA
jgi:hypothetical protein